MGVTQSLRGNRNGDHAKDHAEDNQQAQNIKDLFVAGISFLHCLFPRLSSKDSFANNCGA